MKYLTYDDRYWCLDIESDSLDPIVIWCCCVRNLVTEEEKTFYNKEEFNAWVNDSIRIIIGHNILSYDIPVLHRLWGSDIDLSSCIDSLVLSYLYNPALEGGHSLQAWGQRLRCPKTDFHDYSKLTPEMAEYCRQDVRVTCKLYLALTEKMRRIGYSELSCDIEHRIKVIIEEQQKNGFYFDVKRGWELYNELRERQSDISEKIQRLFPPVSKNVKRCPFKRNKDGGLPSRIEKARDRYHRVEVNESEGYYDLYELQEFNLGSPKQRVERLLQLGWKPTKFTEKGFPKVDEDALIAFADESKREEIRALSEWLVLQGRTSMLEGWLNAVGPDSRIHGRVNSCGASTRRMVHSKPNSANIPSGAKARYGKECRALWCIEPDKGLIQVGADASGLENVGLLHYLNNPEATKLLTQSKPNDVHTLNARGMTEALGFECDREWASKTSFFALVFGAGDDKLGSIVKKGKREGKIIREVIIKNIPGFERLLGDIEAEFKRTGGLLRCIDSGYVRCPARNAALNYLVQSSGAIVMKLACIILHEEAKKQQLSFQLIGTIHDEWQMQCKEQDGDTLGKIAVWSMTEASKRLNFNVPLTGEYRLGKNWAECH